MSKQFITTAIAGASHNADIYSVAVSKPYTITASGDGYLKFWSNSVTETDNAKDFVKEIFIHKTGLHHVSIFEDVIDSIKHVLVATVSFNGQIFFLKVDSNGEIHQLEDVQLDLNINEKDKTYWAIQWLKGQDGGINRFAATQPTGTTIIWDFEINSTGKPTFKHHGTIPSQTKTFATSLDLSSSANLLATGFQNGDVTLTHIDTSKIVYTFQSFGLKGSSKSSTSVRSVKFSPLGKLLAVASDSGSYGTITLYDTVYGENIGSLTIPTHSTNVSVGAYAHEGWIFEVDFNEDGTSLVSAGYDGKVRVWSIATRERESTIGLSPTDVDDEDIIDDGTGIASAFGVKFIKKGVRGGAGGDNNDGLVVIGKDRGIRWYREAGGI